MELSPTTILEGWEVSLSPTINNTILLSLMQPWSLALSPFTTTPLSSKLESGTVLNHQHPTTTALMGFAIPSAPQVLTQTQLDLCVMPVWRTAQLA